MKERNLFFFLFLWYLIKKYYENRMPDQQNLFSEPRLFFYFLSACAMWSLNFVIFSAAERQGVFGMWTTAVR